MNDWKIQSRAHQCQVCGKSFTDKQPFRTLLFDEKKDYLRLDVCEPCWTTQYSEAGRDRKGFISLWHGVYQAPPAAPPEAIRRETAETLLRKLVELNDPKHAAAAFILAVMLERKRILKVKEQVQGEGRRIFIYEHAKSGDVFTIPDPQLQLNQLEQVQHDVAELLERGLPDVVTEVGVIPPPPEPAAAAPPEAETSPLEPEAPSPEEPVAGEPSPNTT